MATASANANLSGTEMHANMTVTPSDCQNSASAVNIVT